MNELLILLVLLCTSLLVGNEFTVGVFINPAFSRLPDVSQAFAARETARIYGKVMPFWMITNFLLCVLLTFLVADRYSTQWWFYLAGTVLFALVCVFSVISPVPVNNKIASWDPNDLPSDWRELRRRFDQYNFVRIVMLLITLICLVFGTISGKAV
jgi:uncharacterized membrane protein